MSHHPILVLQMQRMGDLVLSFPLLGWLTKLYPNHPIWVVGEEAFFRPLMSLSPSVTYFPYASAMDFYGRPFHLVINLSHRVEAATLAGAVTSDQVFGPYCNKKGELYIQGQWQLYRASLTHNNRYNHFHWADLNALDTIPLSLIAGTIWPQPRVSDNESNTAKRIGLFIGASEADKRPDAEFWAAVARQLIRMGHKPVLLGGEAELPLGREVSLLLGTHALNLCGHFSVEELAHFISRLDLLVTPDTGPMHIATWTATPTLNISLGPVNPWETGPFSHGHHILQANIPCAGCWGCMQKQVYCKQSIIAGRAVAAIEGILTHKDMATARFAQATRGTVLLETARTADGLFTLRNITHSAPKETNSFGVTGPVAAPFQAETANDRYLFSHFWQGWFGWQFGIFTKQECTGRLQQLVNAVPYAQQLLVQGVNVLTAGIISARKNKQTPTEYMLKNWQEVPPQLQAYTGYMQMMLQNTTERKVSELQLVESLEVLYSLLKEA